MFENLRKKKMKTQKSASQISPESEMGQEEEMENVQYNWRANSSAVVHIFTFTLLVHTIISTGSYLYIYWVYDLLAQVWIDVAFYVISLCTVVYWSICWWGRIAPKLVTAKHPWKNKRTRELLPNSIWYLLINATMTLLCISEGVNGRVPLSIVVIALGGDIAIRFWTIWKEFRKDLRYKEISFIDYCNLPNERR